MVTRMVLPPPPSYEPADASGSGGGVGTTEGIKVQKSALLETENVGGVAGENGSTRTEDQSRSSVGLPLDHTIDQPQVATTVAEAPAPVPASAPARPTTRKDDTVSWITSVVVLYSSPLLIEIFIICFRLRRNIPLSGWTFALWLKAIGSYHQFMLVTLLIAYYAAATCPGFILRPRQDEERDIEMGEHRGPSQGTSVQAVSSRDAMTKAIQKRESMKVVWFLGVAIVGFLLVIGLEAINGGPLPT